MTYEYFYGNCNVTERVKELLKHQKEFVICNDSFQQDPQVGVYKFLVLRMNGQQFVLGGEEEKTTGLFDFSLSHCSHYHPLTDYVDKKDGLKLGVLNAQYVSETYLFKLPSKLDSTNCPWTAVKTTTLTPHVPDNNYDFVCFDAPHCENISKNVFKNTRQFLKKAGYCIVFASTYPALITEHCNNVIQNMISEGFQIMFTQIVRPNYIVLVGQKQQQKMEESTDENKTKNEHSSLLHVFFAPHLKQPSTNWYEHLFETIPHTTVESKTEANLVVYPDLTTNFHSQNMAYIHNALTDSTNDNKLIVFLLHDDPTEECYIENEDTIKTAKKYLIFRTSVLKSKQLSYERVCPSFQAADHKIQALAPVRWERKPKIGFCGFPTPLRNAACNALLRQDRFETHFVLRPVFFGHFSEFEKDKNKQEFIAIMKECPYQLCCRGAGNFSHRFFETLAYGRIPIVVTEKEMILFPHVPLQEFLECVIVVDTVEELPNALFVFHQTHNLIFILYIQGDFVHYLTFFLFFRNEKSQAPQKKRKKKGQNKKKLGEEGERGKRKNI